MPVYEQEWQASPAIQNQHLMHTGVTYNGTIYTPFDNTVPSDYSAVGASYGQRGPFKSPIDGGGDWEELPDHDHTDLSPVGEPWIMAFFALLFAGVTAWRQHKRLKYETRE